MAKDNTLLIIGIIIVGAFFIQYSDFFGISLTSPETQYNNKDIHAEFKLTNYTNPLIEIFFDGVEIYKFDANETNQTISFEKNLVNETYDFIISGIDNEGTLKIVVSENNITETKVINVLDPYVAVTHNIPNTAEEGDSLKILISTSNPQGELLDADSVTIDVTTPDNTLETLTLTKSGDDFEYNFNYEDAGTYQFKLKAVEIDYKTKEFSAVTTVIKAGGIHPIVWVWMAALIFWATLFIIKYIRTH